MAAADAAGKSALAQIAARIRLHVHILGLPPLFPLAGELASPMSSWRWR